MGLKSMMLGYLPQAIKIHDKTYKIRTDYRDVLRILIAYYDDVLTDKEKIYVCLKQIYIDLDTIPAEYLEEAYKAAISFIDCGMVREEKQKPRLINWEKDEPLIFPAINKVAGFEVRSVDYMHWWTFMGYFQGIDANDTWGFILTIRQKRSRGKKLEKHEQAFFNANTAVCMVDKARNVRAKKDKALQDIYNSLLKGDEE